MLFVSVVVVFCRESVFCVVGGAHVFCSKVMIYWKCFGCSFV